MATHAVGEVFCLYLWRSLELPGTLYLVKSIHNARAVCAELLATGYIVKVVQMGTDVEYRMRDGALVACTDQTSLERVDSDRPSVDRRTGVLGLP